MASRNGLNQKLGQVSIAVFSFWLQQHLHANMLALAQILT
jgi:hypothetical protein